MSSIQTVEKDPELVRLRALISRHQVCWEVYPSTLKTAEGLRQVGFELALLGADDHAEGRTLPGDAECHLVYDALLAIAQWIIPHERRESRYDIEQFQVALNFSRKRGFRRDVRLVISIVHREGFDQPVDPCEVRCLEEMQDKLKELGARLEHW